MPWPPLPLDAWRDTYDTLHMWMQIPGKICLALTPRTNHYWNIAFRVTPRGIATNPMPYEGRLVTMTFDFIAHELVIEASDGAREMVALAPQSVAAFRQRVKDTLGRMSIDVPIWEMPVEFPDPIRFDRDETHRSYDPASARAFWEILVAALPVFEDFRAEFLGKCSPVHFFWGSFDLAVTRFSGLRAPDRPGADAVTRESYSHALISHGFWPGGGPVAEPAFYAYAAPEPDGLKTVVVQPVSASYNQALSEFILPYDAVRTAASPEAVLSAFLHSTYDAAARLARWDRATLERAAAADTPPRPRRTVHES